MIDIINARLSSLVQEKKVPHAALFQAARYSLLSPGKRIRPLFTLEAGKLFGAPVEALLNPACALEMIHTYSLIHDDLPALDNDDERRGRPSLHKAFDEATAILTGDFLLTYAFEVLTQAPLLSAEIKLRLLLILAQAAGSEGMIGGQLLDIHKAPVALKEINAKKTGALFRAAIEFGAVIAGVDAATFDRLSLFGTKIGALFQLVDDILDGDAPLSAKEEAARCHKDILSLLNSLPVDSSPLQHLSEKVLLQVV